MHRFDQDYTGEVGDFHYDLPDYGPRAIVFDIEDVTKSNENFRTTLWTGKHLQLTLMSIPPGENLGMELHNDVDQFIKIEEGEGVIKMGYNRAELGFQEPVSEDYAIVVPAGTWHNLINTGDRPLKLYSIYSPVEHPHGTLHRTKADALKDEGDH